MSYPPPRPPMIPHMPGMPPGSFPYGMMPPPIAGMMGPRPTIPLPALAVEKPPVTTVFVGNISDRAPDMMVRQMLQRCGHVVSWKRVQGVSGKLQTFGFCEFDNPEATLRCIRLLNGYEILDKKLSVKVDQKTREQLSEYLKKINANKNPKKVGGRNHMTNESASATGDMFNLEQTDENTLKDDRMVLNGFEMLMKQYASQMNEQPEQLTVSSEFVPNTNISSIPQSEMTSAELKLASMEAAAALIKEEEKKKEIPVEQSPPVSEETVAKKPKLEEKVIREKERPAPSRDRVRTPPPKSRRSPSPSSSPSVASRYDRRGQHERTRSRSPARMKRRVSPD